MTLIQNLRKYSKKQGLNLVEPAKLPGLQTELKSQLFLIKYQ